MFVTKTFVYQIIDPKSQILTLKMVILEEDQSQILQTVKKIIINLQSEDKRHRKNAFTELSKCLFDTNVQLTPEEYHEVFNEIHIYALNGFRDKSEQVREEAIKFIQCLIVDKLAINDYYLSYLFPVFLERIGSCEIIEESEEIRLQLNQFLQAIIIRFTTNDLLKPFLEDIVKIFSETVKDKYPAIKEITCKNIILLAQALPRDFHTEAENLIKPVLTAFGHQRYKIRVEAIKCIGEIIMHSSYKGLEEVLVPMAERLFDSMPVVRKTVAQVAARWLLEYRDRYSFFQKLLPLLLTGLNDEVADTREESYRLWHIVGLQYQKENEEDLKNQIDFLNFPPKYYVENLERPNLGCRILVQRNIGKMAVALSKELGSWQRDVRIRCSQLLCALTLYAEDGFTQHLQSILPAMYTAAKDEESTVVTNIAKASEYIGLFITPETWTKLVLPCFEDNPHYGYLIVLSGLIKGAPKEYIGEHLENISKVLANVCQSRNARYQKELIKCVEAIEGKLTCNYPAIGLNLFIIIVTLISIKDKDNWDIDITLLDKLYKVLEYKSNYELWHRYLSKLLTLIQRDPHSWTIITVERCIFDLILLESKKAFGENLEAIGNILIEALNIENDPESRLKTFMALSTTFKQKDIIFEDALNLPQFLEKLFSICINTLVWRPGQTAEAMRTMAASCLHSALSPSSQIELFNTSKSLRKLTDQLIPLLISLTEDPSSLSRLLALENLGLIKELLCKKYNWKVEDLLKIYPEIVKRLDDPTEKVRICAIKILLVIFKNFPNDFKSITFKSHHELLLDTLLTHFDDDDEDFQNVVLDILKVFVEISQEVVIDKIKKHKPVLRNQSGCDKISLYLEELKI